MKKVYLARQFSKYNDWKGGFVVGSAEEAVVKLKGLGAVDEG
jgi:hypothetical protein